MKKKGDWKEKKRNKNIRECKKENEGKIRCYFFVFFTSTLQLERVRLQLAGVLEGVEHAPIRVIRGIHARERQCCHHKRLKVCCHLGSKRHARQPRRTWRESCESTHFRVQRALSK